MERLILHNGWWRARLHQVGPLIELNNRTIVLMLKGWKTPKIGVCAVIRCGEYETRSAYQTLNTNNGLGYINWCYFRVIISRKVLRRNNLSRIILDSFIREITISLKPINDKTYQGLISSHLIASCNSTRIKYCGGPQ